MKLQWRAMALDDRQKIMDDIAQNNINIAVEVDQEFEKRARKVRENPELYKVGRVHGTREILINDDYIMVYRIVGVAVEIMRILYSEQKWTEVKENS